MSVFSNLLRGVDFTNGRVIFILLGLFLLVFIIVFAIFILCKLWIPKSKLHDEQTILNAINQLEKIMRFDKAALFLCVTILLVFICLHFLNLIDIFQPPFRTIGMICAGLIPVFFTAVLGVRSSISSNQLKLGQLKQLLRD